MGGFIYEERASDSPYVESITHGYSAGNGSVTRPAEVHWHLVLAKHNGSVQTIIAGPLKSSGIVNVIEGVELLWIKFKLGTFIPHLPMRKLLDIETTLPEASSNSFWLNSSAWQLPTYENVDTFVDRLARDGALECDPVVSAALRDELPDEIPARTVRHRFLRSTGLPQSHIRQFERAQRATALLEQGVPILDTVHEAGYFDQAHLTRSLKQLIGYTPAQILRSDQPD